MPLDTTTINSISSPLCSSELDSPTDSGFMYP